MAAARAAARRQAILSSRGNRLAKLTSSARGDDPGGVYTNDDPPLPTIGGTGLENFVGETTELPKPSAPPPNIVDAQPLGWGSEQQQDFMRTLMSGVPRQERLGPPPFNTNNTGPDAPSAPEDPFSSLLATLGGGVGGPFATSEVPPPPRPRTFMQKLIPIFHALSMFAILAWFIGWKEPEGFGNIWNMRTDKTSSNKPETPAAGWGTDKDDERWTRWARLSQNSSIGGMAVPSMPAFFWAFTTLQLVLHSLRLVSQPNAYRPPMLLGLVMPYLPPPLPQAILMSLKYLQMGSMVLDDLAILVFGVGLVVFVSSNWIT